jgi:cytochrome c biogenesis protein CcmG, thiol:disulfide interchange protein DsbE
MELEGISSERLQSQEPAVEPVAGKPRSGKRNITFVIVISIVNVGLLVLLWTQLLTPANKQSDTNTGNTSTLGDISSPLIGKPAPDFTLSLLNGSSAKLRLADFKGKDVVLNFWSSTCEPCKAEMPFLQNSWSRMQSQGMVFIGIDQPESTSSAQSFLQKYGITYPNVQDSINSTTTTDYGVTGTPETLFINKEGIVVAKWIAPLTEQGWQLEMAKLSRPLK